MGRQVNIALGGQLPIYIDPANVATLQDLLHTNDEGWMEEAVRLNFTNGIKLVIPRDRALSAHDIAYRFIDEAHTMIPFPWRNPDASSPDGHRMAYASYINAAAILYVEASDNELPGQGKVDYRRVVMGIEGQNYESETSALFAAEEKIFLRLLHGTIPDLVTVDPSKAQGGAWGKGYTIYDPKRARSVTCDISKVSIGFENGSAATFYFNDGKAPVQSAQEIFEEDEVLQKRAETDPKGAWAEAMKRGSAAFAQSGRRNLDAIHAFAREMAGNISGLHEFEKAVHPAYIRPACIRTLATSTEEPFVFTIREAAPEKNVPRSWNVYFENKGDLLEALAQVREKIPAEKLNVHKKYGSSPPRPEGP